MRRMRLNRLRLIGSRLGLGRDWSLIMIAMVIGLVMGGVAIAFIIPLHWVEQWTERADRTLLLFLVPLAPIAGALLTGVVLRYLGEEGHAPGVSAVMYSIHRKQSRLELKLALGKWLASSLTIGSGGSAGAEGPIVTIGSVIGSNISRLFGANPENRATLLGCGAAAGISSVFNAPIAGIFFVLEVLLRDFSLRTFTPIVIASVISAAFTKAVLAQGALFATRANFQVDAFTFLEIPNYLLLGMTCGLVAAIFARGLTASERFFASVRAPALLKPALGAAALGLMGVIYVLVARPGRGVPEFYGNGYPVIRDLLSADWYSGAHGSTVRLPGLFWLIVALASLKIIATWLTIGSGGSGGLFAPSLLLGACVGGAFGCVVKSLGWFPAATPAHYALVGMAAMIAATSHAPLTAILLVYELTQSYDIILPLMLAAVISTITGRLVYPESVYTAKLTQLGVRLGGLSDLTILRRMTASDVPLIKAVILRSDEPAQRLLELSEQHLARDFVVVEDDGSYAGMVTGADVAAALVYREAIPLLQVRDVLRSDLPVVRPHETLDIVLDKFSTHDAQSLVVIDEPAGVRGLITRSRLMERYQAALARD